MNQQADSLQIKKNLTAPYSSVVLAGVLLLALMSTCMLYTLNSLGFESPTAIYMFLAGGVATTSVALLLVATRRIHGRFTMDNNVGGVQKSHCTPVPRIGGVSIFAGLAVIALGGWRFGPGLPEAVKADFPAMLAGLLLCALPATVSGFVEDVTKKVSVKTRLLSTLASGLLACFFIDAVIPKFDVWGLDSLMAHSAFAMLATAFCAGGVVLIASGFALLGAAVNDPNLVLLALTVPAVSAGFLVVSYPVLELVVSMVRRKLKKVSPGDPARRHMHQQIQLALRHAFGCYAQDLHTQKLSTHMHSVNTQVSALVWVLVAGTVFVALMFKNAGVWVSLGSPFAQ